MLRKLTKILIVILFIVMVFSGGKVISILVQNSNDKKDFEALHNLVQSAPEDAEQTKQTGRNLSALFKKNADCVGWLYISGTTVDYPFVHTPNEPQKYLRKNLDGKYSRSGVPFLQGSCSVDSDNLIIYGHNMQNGTVFSDITKYRYKDFCLEHPTIEIETANGLSLYTVFAALRVKDIDEWYSFVNAANETDYNQKITDIKARALYTTDVLPTYPNQLLTLSTCYGAEEDDRLIVIAVKNNEAV